MQHHRQPAGAGVPASGTSSNPFGAPQTRPPKSSGGSTTRLVLGIVVAVLGVMLLLAGGGYYAWNAFLEFGMVTDVQDYVLAVEASDLEATVEASLRERLERIEEGLRSGELNYSLFEWIPLDERVDELVGDGYVAPEEVSELTEALETMEEMGR